MQLQKRTPTPEAYQKNPVHHDRTPIPESRVPNTDDLYDERAETVTRTGC